MMIKKIISGGQTGADRAGLDVAIKLGIAHGGWVPKGRKTENGALPNRYQLQEMGTSSYPDRTEKNVLDSDGTLIFSHGKLTGGSALTLNLAKKYDRAWLHVDLDRLNTFDAAHLINSWIVRHGVRILNVAGPPASKDPAIYQTTSKVLETAFRLAFVETKLAHPDSNSTRFPQTVKEAVERLVSELPLRDKTKIANATEEGLTSFQPTLGTHIRKNFGLLAGNYELMESCRFISDQDQLDVDDALGLIIKELWKQLRETHLLRVVKK
jgi:hypothetical protein